MKKIVFSGLTGLFLVLAISITANGQSSIAKAELPKDLTHHKKVSESNFKSVSRAEVNHRAVKNFARNYKTQSNEDWYDVTGGFIAKFTSNDINHRVDYDKKGNWLRTIRTYNEAKLPRDVRHIVRSTYYDYDINLVQEIETPFSVENPLNSVVYLIYLEGKTEMINLRICEGEMYEWQRFAKSK